MIFRTLRRLLRLIIIVVIALALVVVGLRVTNPRLSERGGWSRLRDLPAARGEVASAVGDGKLYVIGGLRGLGTVADAVSVYDIEADRWERRTTRGPKTHHAAAATVDGSVYVTGGADSATDWTPSDALTRLSRGRTATLRRMPEGRQGHAMVALGDRLYVVGGVGETSDTLIYDVRRARWTRGADLPLPRDHLRAVAWRGKVWTIGGRTGDPVRRVDVYDPRKDSWTRGPDLPEPMSAMAVGVIDDTLRVIGGEDPDLFGGRVSDDHFVLDRGAEQWLTGTPALLAVHGGGYGVHEDKLIIVGGASRQGALSTISWTDVTQVFRP